MDRAGRAGWLARALLCLLIGVSGIGCHGYRDVNLHGDAHRPIGWTYFPNLRLNVAPPEGKFLQSAETTLQELRSWVQDAQDASHPVQLKFSSNVERKRNPYTFTGCVLTLGVVPATAKWTARSELVVVAYGEQVHAHTVTEHVRETVVALGAWIGLGGGGDTDARDVMERHLFDRSMAAHRTALFDTLHKHGQEYLAFVNDGGAEANRRFVQTHRSSLFRELAEQRAGEAPANTQAASAPETSSSAVPATESTPVVPTTETSTPTTPIESNTPAAPATEAM
ncbi:MAG: hypothetical protein QM778_17150 [Myxococcales bacterium]